ncbi:MAG: carbohydrate kinase family protein [Treponemataceae bacterium]|nr:carbohydrate kinase family protein [Treponemataceae bacterium]
MKDQKHSVLSVGNVSVDIKAYSGEDPVPGAYRDGSIELVPGGVGRGMAINLKHLGFPSAVCSVVGKDIFGDFLKAGLEKENIGTELLKTSPCNKTALFSVMASSGQPALCVYSTRILQEIVFDDPVREYLADGNCDILCMDSNLPEESLADFYKYVSDKDIFVFQNTTAPDIARKSLPYAKRVDLFGCNEFEAAAILGEEAFPDPACAGKIAALGFRHFIITFGDRGVMVYKDGEVWNEKPFNPSYIEDTVGAGDAFASGYIFGFTTGQPVKRCIQYGLLSARETLHTRQTVSEFLSPDFLESYTD